MAPGGVLAQDTRVDIQQYDNGGIYEGGSSRNGVQHGTGTYRLPNGFTNTPAIGSMAKSAVRAWPASPTGRSNEKAEFAAGRPHGHGLDHLRRRLHL